MKEKNYHKNSFVDRSLSEESICLLDWNTLKTQLSSFASTKMGKNAILDFEIPTFHENLTLLLFLQKLMSLSNSITNSKAANLCSQEIRMSRQFHMHLKKITRIMEARKTTSKAKMRLK